MDIVDVFSELVYLLVLAFQPLHVPPLAKPRVYNTAYQQGYQYIANGYLYAELTGVGHCFFTHLPFMFILPK